jgi:predicted enzyme related to lactoylglutathione lyase
MNRVVHFEIHAQDPGKLADFYRKVFGWELNKWENPGDEYWLVTTGPAIEEGKIAGPAGINGGLLKRHGESPKGGEPVNSFVCTLDVVNVDETLTAVKAAGGSVASPKTAMPGLAWLAYCKDPDGNIFGVYQEDPSAK